MKIDDTFYVIKEVATGRLLRSAKSPGIAVYKSEASANRAFPQRQEVQYKRVPNPDYVEGTDINTLYAQLKASGRRDWYTEYHRVAFPTKQVRAEPGDWIVVAVKLSEVVNG